MNGWWFAALLWLASPDAPALEPHDAKAFTITARRFTYSVSPQPFIVNQGDVVTLTLTAADDGAGSGHGFRMFPYAPDSVTLTPGAEPVTIQFTAHTAGTFQFFCTRFCGSGHGSMDGVFTVVAPTTLSVTDVSPSTGPNNGGTTVTIQGTGFATGATVKFGTIPAASVEVENATEIRAVTPAGPFDFSSTRTVDVVVTNPNGATAQTSFTWTVPPPSIASISPSSGTRSGGTLVTIRGAGFSTAVPAALTFGGAAATSVTVVDATTLTARTPAHATGTVDVEIATSKGSASAPNAYRFRSTKRRAVRR